MSALVIIPEREPRRRLSSTSAPARIARELAPGGVRFERWPAVNVREDPVSAHAARIQPLRAAGYATIDVVRVAPIDSDPSWPDKARATREKFRDEHTHAEDEVRFFVDGSGVFYLRFDGKVHSVPAGTRRWFDMGSVPSFTAIRFFRSAEGWVGDFSGDSIARSSPGHDELVLEAHATRAAPLEASP